MSQGPGRPSGEDGERRSAPVSPLAVPLLMLGLLVGFLSGYMLLWWGAVIVLVAALIALSMAVSGTHRDAAAALVVGTAGSYLVVMLLAGFRGVLW